MQFVKSITVITVATLWLAACHSKKETFNEVKPDCVVQSTYTTVQEGNLGSDVAIPGELISYQQVDLYAKVTSFVKALNVDLGSQVHKGQVLAVLEAPEMTAQLAAARQQLNSQMAVATASQSTYTRLKETSKTPGTVSQNDLTLALSKKNADQAQLASAREAYNQIAEMKGYLIIRAPFNGVITARNVGLGAYVGPNGKGSVLPMFTLQQQNHMRLTVMVPEIYSNYLKTGNAVKFTVRAFPDKVFYAKVNRMAGALDPQLRTQKVEMDVYDDSHTLLPGMAAQVQLNIGTNVKVNHVPTTAVLETTTLGNVVITNVNGAAKWIRVQKGRESDGQTEIFGEVQPGTRILSNPSEEIRDGQKL